MPEMPKMPDNEFLRELFQNYKQMMFKTALGILHNSSDAEDVVQNAFLWIIDNLDRISQIPCNERGFYFAKITEHNAIDLLRKRNIHPTEDIDEKDDLSSETDVEDGVLSKLTVEQIKSALQELSDRDYDLLYLYLFREMNHKEIGEIMGIPENNVRVYIQRARKRFIKILKKRGIIDDI